MKSLLPKITKDVADRHSAELYTEVRNNTLMNIFLKLGKEDTR